MAHPAIFIQDSTDPRIAPYLGVRERDLVGRDGLFMAEGEVVLRVLAQSPEVEPVSILVTEKRLAGLEDILTHLAPETPVYTADQSVMDQIVGFPIHRGILAVGRRRRVPSADAVLAGLGPKALIMVLCGIANHDNMGGLFRNAAAFGVDAILLDAESCDPLYRKAIRVSVGGTLVMPFARLGSGDDLSDLLQRYGFASLALSPSGETTLADLPRPARAAILLGAEGPGLSAQVLARSQTVRIPMAEGFDSLNVATTAAVVLHHLRFVASDV